MRARHRRAAVKVEVATGVPWRGHRGQDVLAWGDDVRLEEVAAAREERAARSIEAEDVEPSPWAPEVALARMDIDEPVIEALARVEAGRHGGRALLGLAPGGRANRCPFVEKGSVSVRWDGAISPCLPLLHGHRSYLDFRPRTSHAFAVGNVNERSLLEAWGDPAYVALRERLIAFDFAPCTTCNSCDMADENLEDCFGSPTPACGGCLWAQGFIRCP